MSIAVKHLSSSSRGWSFLVQERVTGCPLSLEWQMVGCLTHQHVRTYPEDIRSRQVSSPTVMLDEIRKGLGMSDDDAATLGRFPAATLYEAMGKSGGMGPQIRPMVPSVPLAGPAFTVRILGPQSAAVVTAIDCAPSGAVLVIDTGTSGVATVWGGTSSLAAQVRGLAGVVTNGLVRDLDEMIEIGLPVFATGACVMGTLKDHPGWHQVPVSVSGVIVRPGDFVVGDADGVVVVPREQARQVLVNCRQQRAKEEERDARIRAGESISDVLGLRG